MGHTRPSASSTRTTRNGRQPGTGHVCDTTLVPRRRTPSSHGTSTSSPSGVRNIVTTVACETTDGKREGIGVKEGRPRRDAGHPGVVRGPENQRLLLLDPDGRRPGPGGRQHEAPVARTDVDEHVLTAVAEQADGPVDDLHPARLVDGQRPAHAAPGIEHRIQRPERPRTPRRGDREDGRGNQEHRQKRPTEMSRPDDQQPLADVTKHDQHLAVRNAHHGLPPCLKTHTLDHGRAAPRALDAQRVGPPPCAMNRKNRPSLSVHAVTGNHASGSTISTRWGRPPGRTGTTRPVARSHSGRVPTTNTISTPPRANAASRLKLPRARITNSPPPRPRTVDRRIERLLRHPAPRQAPRIDTGGALDAPPRPTTRCDGPPGPWTSA